jgi:hypothetical protein
MLHKGDGLWKGYYMEIMGAKIVLFGWISEIEKDETA